jgi:hypothetical protein
MDRITIFFFDHTRENMDYGVWTRNYSDNIFQREGSLDNGYLDNFDNEFSNKYEKRS